VVELLTFPFFSQRHHRVGHLVAAGVLQGGRHSGGAPRGGGQQQRRVRHEPGAAPGRARCRRRRLGVTLCRSLQVSNES
jgi:hypothetical protein